MAENELTARADREAAALIIAAEVIPGISLNPAGVTVHQLVPAGVTVHQLVARAYLWGYEQATDDAAQLRRMENDAERLQEDLR
jgi:hypothetical protein